MYAIIYLFLTFSGLSAKPIVLVFHVAGQYLMFLVILLLKWEHQVLHFTRSGASSLAQNAFYISGFAWFLSFFQSGILLIFYINLSGKFLLKSCYVLFYFRAEEIK